MIRLDYPQGSNEWILARLPRLTASTAKPFITSKGKLSRSATSKKALHKLFAGQMFVDAVRSCPAAYKNMEQMDDWQLQDQIANYTGDKFKGNVHTLRGNEFEHEVIAALSERVGEQFQEVGMIIKGDSESGLVSCSPDGESVAGGRMLAGGEVKSPTLATFLNYVSADVLPDEHALQVHFSMAVCDVDLWHFGAMFTGSPLFYKRVERTELTDTIQAALEEFEEYHAEEYRTVMSNLNRKQEQAPKQESLSEIF